jgi:hypothetical protein
VIRRRSGKEEIKKKGQEGKTKKERERKGERNKSVRRVLFSKLSGV